MATWVIWAGRKGPHGHYPICLSVECDGSQQAFGALRRLCARHPNYQFTLRSAEFTRQLVVCTGAAIQSLQQAVSTRVSHEN